MMKEFSFNVRTFCTRRQKIYIDFDIAQELSVATLHPRGSLLYRISLVLQNHTPN